ncbi:MAG: Spy/CpxP family protein refolding chaperone, partial [Myxococcaceae bacterium]
MKRLLLYGILALSLAANATVLLFAVRARMMKSDALPLVARVGLDEEQRQKVMALREGFLEYRRANQARAEQQRVRLSELLKTDPPDRAQIDAVLALMTELQIALQRRVVDQALSVRAVLRPDQRPAFEALMTERLRAGTPLQGADPP